MTEQRSLTAFRSPWQQPGFVRLVALTRGALRLWPALEKRFINRLVEQQNRRVRAYLMDHPPRTVLIIMPRCVKKTGCHAQVQESLDQCLPCGECALGDIAHLCLAHGVTALVAFRSHIAFAMARTERPDLIIASACEDRMIKALRSTPEFPALLAPLSGMRKMCLDAGVDLDWIAAQLQAFSPALFVDQRQKAQGS